VTSPPGPCEARWFAFDGRSGCILVPLQGQTRVEARARSGWKIKQAVRLAEVATLEAASKRGGSGENERHLHLRSLPIAGTLAIGSYWPFPCTFPHRSLH